VKWLKFIRLSSSDRLLFLKIATLLLATRFALLWVPYKTILDRFEVLSRSPVERNQSPETIQQCIDSVIYLSNAAGRRVLGSRPCLPKALVVECLLQRRSINAVFQIGVTKGVNDRLLAHAWVEYQGEIIIGGRLSEARYARLRPLKPESS